MKKYNNFLNEKESKTFTVHIQWEHGDADTDINESYSFKSKEEMDEFLHFIYDLRGPNKQENSFTEKEYWYFEDGHDERVRSWVDAISKKYDDKFIDMIPYDKHFSDYRPAINRIYTTIGKKKHYIVWLELLNKEENIIDLPNIGKEMMCSIGHISAHWKPFLKGRNKKDFIGHWELDKLPLLKTTRYKDKNNFEKAIYPEIKTRVIDCKIDIESAKEYNYDYETFSYLILLEIIDDRLGDLNGKFCETGMNGFDPNFEKKFHHEKYDGLSYYDVK